MDELKWPLMAPWLSIPEWAQFMYVDRSTLSRKIPEWMEEGLIVCRKGGRLVRPRNRHILDIGGLAKMFPERHQHTGSFDSHEHYPLDPDWQDHAHPGYFNGYAGALDLWERLQLIEMWYSVAPKVLQGEGAAWTEDGRPRRILSWRWLRNTRFLDALAVYEDDYKVFFGHIGLSITAKMLEHRWKNRFPGVLDERHDKLAWSSRGEREFWRNIGLIPPEPDPDFNPQGSGYVISTPDYRGVDLAREVLPKHLAYLYLVGRPPSKLSYAGRAEPAPHDDVADAFEDVDVDSRLPRDLCL